MSTPEAVSSPAGSPVDSPTKPSARRVNIRYINTHPTSNFEGLATHTDKSLHHVLVQIVKHLERGIYRIVSLEAAEDKCTVVVSTEKKHDEIMWRNGFPWDIESEPLREIVLK
ncbi:hypothetical protein BR93DRAFT_936286 [Coniochaeta sp. PMI_546]|nr:hypothetical protein BR93DRAFT_936286 [Coniochaeta sp. PMI_546]